MIDRITPAHIFWFGFFIKALLIAYIMPTAPSDWYLPFLKVSLETRSLDPWKTWIISGGDLLAFPYGYMTWLVLLPLQALSHFLEVNPWHGYAVTLLIVDFLLLKVFLATWGNELKKRIVILYWLSPITIIATYYLGYNDVIPIFFLSTALLEIKKERLSYAGFFLALAISSKVSMILSLPIFIIYLIKKKNIIQIRNQFIYGFIFGFALFILPFFHSIEGMYMLVQNPDIKKVYNLSLQIGSNTTLYIVPLCYLIAIFLFWRIHRLNFDVLLGGLGIVFILVVILTPASPGWFIWCIPALLHYQIKAGKRSFILCFLFLAAYIAMLMTNSLKISQGLIAAEPFSSLLTPSNYLNSITQTILIGLGIIILYKIWEETISKNDFFRFSRKPFTIGIAGDSGSGKDTIVNNVTNLLGKHSVTHLSGDDYHNWDRHKPMWKFMTHLNPMANNLERFTLDLINLTNNKHIFTRRYNHKTGKYSKPLRIVSNDFILCSGLHALYTPILRDCYDLKIYLDIDENLRQLLKIKRDSKDRGHSLEKILESISKRESDAKKFIHPQSEHCDVKLSIQPVNTNFEIALNTPLPKLKLSVESQKEFNEISIARTLISICGVHVEHDTDPKSGVTHLVIEGDCSSEDIYVAAKIICPHLVDFIDYDSKWLDGMSGIIQLIIMAHINQALTKRLIK